ncbi:2-iminoacetate synthase [Anaerohalosphaera lusitana]|uniref:2-iminoacetate synthase n=1 Tax=Anaerohalosphaera lusitana TaxID=1936003 RepID=A0A1U9NK45_9BACT|nr:[FeFe] hydrogenase H-cluster radical SAM maturase HydE [Anaerohalosphaera lusitana]AQT68279.1 2-iminoacetate synthase [Anaerohalosphaera lusitana]
MSDVRAVLNRVYTADMPDLRDIEYLLSLEDADQIDELYKFADNVRREQVGDGVLLRGIVEFSNYCRNTCAYCGLNKYNKQIRRYRMAHDEIMACLDKIVSCNTKTVVLQSGEEDELDAAWLQDLLFKIKDKHDIAVTLSLGERSDQEFEMWRNAGADRYLLKIETSDKQLYEKLHPEMSFDRRVECLRKLGSMGYQLGSGCMVGLKGQTTASLARDVQFFVREKIAMIGIGPFIPHSQTECANHACGDVELVCKMTAVTRIATKNTHMPATTALGSLGNGDMRLKALACGANVLMPNFTPVEYKKLYEIYPGKRCVNEPTGACSGCMEKMVKSIGRYVDWARGDTLKSYN